MNVLFSNKKRKRESVVCCFHRCAGNVTQRSFVLVSHLNHFDNSLASGYIFLFNACIIILGNGNAAKF